MSFDFFLMAIKSEFFIYNYIYNLTGTFLCTSKSDKLHIKKRDIAKCQIFIIIHYCIYPIELPSALRAIIDISNIIHYYYITS